MSTMKILDDLVSTLNMEPVVKDIRQGLFHTGVLTDRCGLAATLPRDALLQEHPSVREPGDLLQKSTPDIVRMAYSDIITEAAIGMAAINSLLEVDENRCLNLNAGNLITERGAGKKVVIVGHFPFIPNLRKSAKELRVIEKNPQEGDFTEKDAGVFIPQADVVGITGTTFTNHTLEQLLEYSLLKSILYIILGLFALVLFFTRVKVMRSRCRSALLP